MLVKLVFFCVSGAVLLPLLIYDYLESSRPEDRRPTYNYLPLARTKPGEAEVAGTWAPDETTVNFLVAGGDYPQSAQPAITLRPDRTAIMINVPNWWTDEPRHKRWKYASRVGRWKLSQVDGFWKVGFDFPGESAGADLVGGAHDYGLSVNIEAPLRGRRLNFVKLDEQ